MPRLSLYKPERGQDYTFMDRTISESFQVGGTDVYLHKYLGTQVTDENGNVVSKDITQIQDMLFLENRDRKYDTEIYRLRGIYNVQNIDFNLSQFGLFIDNDTIFMTVHINDFIKYVGRKPISGDVLELPHLRDEFALSTADISLPRYYVIEDVGRASEGFSATWYPHLYRLRLKRLVNNQQFADILNKPTGADADKFVGDYVDGNTYYTGQITRVGTTMYQVIPGFEAPTGTTLTPPDVTAWAVYGGTTLESVLSTRAKELQINDAILNEAETDAAKSGYETGQFYTLAVDQYGNSVLNTADTSALDASVGSYTTSENNARPLRTGYTGYLVGDGIPQNGYDFGHGIQFPEGAGVDDFFLRTDFMPSRLFRFDGSRWIKVEDNVRMTMTNNNSRQTLKTGFINNTKYLYNDVIIADYLTLDIGDTVIETDIPYETQYTTAKYVTLKLSIVEIGYVVSENPGIITSFVYTEPTTGATSTRIKITLPEPVADAGQYKIALCNHRESERQSLSKALRPKADL